MRDALLARRVGKWILDPATLSYEHGRPGLRAIYTIEPANPGLTFHLDANDADGKLLRVTYGGALDGSEQQLPGDAVLALTQLSDCVIESTLKRNGQVVDRWTREILPDGTTMIITQHGFKPTDEPFQNRGVYRRES